MNPSIKTAAIIFPHQLFSNNPVLRSNPDKVLLIEDSLFFGDQQYWRWILVNREKLAGNYRWAMICKQADKMDSKKRERVMKTADAYLATAFRGT